MDHISGDMVRHFLPLRSTHLTIRGKMHTEFRVNYDEGQGDVEKCTWMVPVEESFMAFELGLGKSFIDGDWWSMLITIC